MAAWNCSIEELARATNGRVLSRPDAEFSRVSSDSRADLKGRLFIPLKGDRFDAHDFVPQAVEGGAAVVLVHIWREEWRPLLARAAFVQVGDTLKALQEFARYWRRKHAFKVLAITGSNGKTSTKEFALALLKPHFRVHASKGSFNNHWGVPLSILEAGPEHTHLILEMGMNHAGEILRLCQIGEPDVCVVTMVGRAHIGELGSQMAVAQAKEEIYAASPRATHIFNMDNEWTARMQGRSHAKQIIFSSTCETVDIHMRVERMSWNGLELSGAIGGEKGTTQVSVLGRHNVTNLMAAAALALACGLEPAKIWDGLGKIRDVAWGRNQVVPLENGARIFFDAYNANPDSMSTLLKNLLDMDVQGRKHLILGDMRELGEFAAAAHEEIGQQAAGVDFESVWFVGEHAAAFWKGFEKVRKPARAFTSGKVDPEVARAFLEGVGAGDLVALKASRGVGLEKALERWPLAAPLGEKP